MDIAAAASLSAFVIAAGETTLCSALSQEAEVLQVGSEGKACHVLLSVGLIACFLPGKACLPQSKVLFLRDPETQLLELAGVWFCDRGLLPARGDWVLRTMLILVEIVLWAQQKIDVIRLQATLFKPLVGYRR